MLAFVACVLGASAVDVGARVEQRLNALAETPTGDVFALQTAVTPSARFLVDGPLLRFDASYAPQISIVVPSQRLLLLLHQASLSSTVRLSRTTTLTVASTLRAGDVDAGTFVRDFGATQAASFKGLQALSFPLVQGDIRASLFHRLERQTTLEASLLVDGIGGFASDSLVGAATVPSQARVRTTLGVRRQRHTTDTVGLFAVAEASRSSNFGDVATLGARVEATQRFRLGTATVQNACRTGGQSGGFRDQRSQWRLIALPVVEDEISATLPLSSSSTVEGSLLLSLAPFLSPLSGQLDERLGASGRLAWRINREWSLFATGAVFSLVRSLSTLDLAATPTTAGSAAVGMVWQFNDALAAEAQVATSQRVLSDIYKNPSELQTDAIFFVSITGTWTVWGEGTRPAGTDSRRGRNIGKVTAQPGVVALPGEDTTADTNKKESQKELEKAKKKDPT
jgi:hypothetical protein